VGLSRLTQLNQPLKPTRASFSEGTERETSSYPTMLRARDSELIFPIKDAASAAVMLIKADCLHNAGVINEEERQWVYSRARTFLDGATLKDTAGSPCALADLSNSS
jgi:hypothetical protein